MALVGRNGSGKTTLLKILCGEMEPDTGTVQVSKGAKIGYLSQRSAVTKGRTVLEEALSAVEERAAVWHRMEELEKLLDHEPTSEQLEEYAVLHERFVEAEGYALEGQVRSVLQRLGFTESEFEKSTDELSGGQATRLGLARLLLEEPDLLILDEPTNHLDLEATEWLEGWVRRYPGAVLVVSHDRVFLEAVGDKVVEMRDGKLFAYPGPFEHYLRVREEEMERQTEVAKRQDQQIAKMDEYVRRFMNSQRTAQARGRLKLMNRLEANKVEAPKKEKLMMGTFQAEKRSGVVATEVHKLTIGYDKPLFEGLDWTVRYGERWGVVGQNGIGKSTLIKTIMGEVAPLAGKSKVGSNVELGYFSQDARDLDPEQSPLDLLVWECDMPPNEARNLLGQFLLSGDDVFRPMKTLSGGEQNKVALARLSRMNPNLLVLDEPTNHLDRESRERLAGLLSEFNGTLILVSHDRWLLGKVTNHTLDLRRDGARQFGGSYAEYRRAPVQTPTKAPTKGKAVEVIRPTLTQRELSKLIAASERELRSAEAEVGKLELELKQVEERLANPGEHATALSHKYADIQAALNLAMGNWEKVASELEELRA